MMGSKRWEYQCSQFVDFNDVDASNGDVEAYFDSREETHLGNLFHETNNGVSQALPGDIASASGTNEQSQPKKEQRSVYKFKASYYDSKPKSVVKDKKKVTNNMFSAEVKIRQKPTSRPFVAKNKHNLRPSVRTTVKSTKKPLVVSAPTRVPRERNLPAVLPVAVPHERNPPAPAAATAGPSTQHPTRPRFTQPTTPQCLKRSLNKSKVIKSSEELELERIAAMRQKMKTDLNLNKATMKKARAPAFRPIVERPKPTATISTETEPKQVGTDAQKKLEAGFKKPAMLRRAKSSSVFEARRTIPKVVMNPSTPYNLRLNRRFSRSDSALSRTSQVNTIVERSKPTATTSTETEPKQVGADAQKKMETGFKKPAMMQRAKSISGFEARKTVPKVVIQNPSTPYNLRLDRRLSRSDSSLSHISRAHSHSKSFNKLHTGMQFIPKKDSKFRASSSSAVKSNENAAPWRTPKMSETNIQRRALMKQQNLAIPKIQKAFRDCTNLSASMYVPKKKGIKRCSSVSLNVTEGGKRRRC